MQLFPDLWHVITLLKATVALLQDTQGCQFNTILTQTCQYLMPRPITYYIKPKV